MPPPPNFQQRSNQMRTLFGYGDIEPARMERRSSARATISRSRRFKTRSSRSTYNGNCCGMGFEYRRFSFGTIRNENQYSIVIRIANLGSAGNLRRQEKIF